MLRQKIKMWENSKDKNDGSMKNILKSFDPYAVLEPLTPQGIPKENILVDLTNSQNNDNPELSGSFLDKSTKSDFEVIDVFQNLYVTPQHVKGKNHLGNSKDNKDWMKAFDGIDHKNNEEIDTKKELESIFKVNTKINATITRLSDDEFDVDEIDEILTVKRIEKAMKLKQNHVGSPSNYVETRSNLNTIDIKDTERENIVENYAKAEINTKLEEIKQDDVIKNVLNNNNIFQNKSTELRATKLNIQMIKTIKLDKKKLQKKVVLPDHVKQSYTKGPDFVEKSIALPAMIERIKARQQLINNQECLKRRLILEPGDVTFVPHSTPITNDASYVFHPQILTEDCNKRRLTALQAGRAFETFVTGKE